MFSDHIINITHVSLLCDILPRKKFACGREKNCLANKHVTSVKMAHCNRGLALSHFAMINAHDALYKPVSQ